MYCTTVAKQVHVVHSRFVSRTFSRSRVSDILNVQFSSCFSQQPLLLLQQENNSIKQTKFKVVFFVSRNYFHVNYWQPELQVTESGGVPLVLELLNTTYYY